PRCEIYLYATAQEYAKGANATTASFGYATINLDGGRVVSRRIDIRTDNASMLTCELPHETTHVTLAGHFGRHDVPRWADEGMAVLSETEARVKLHLAELPKHRREGTLFQLSRLLPMHDFPRPRDIGVFYAQSVSLVA